MKKSLFLFIVLLAVSIMRAGVVTEQQALQKAQQFMKGKKFLSKSQPRMSGGGESSIRSMYIFNAENKGGFVIVSADDRTDAILGYADSGEMDVNNLPPNVRGWLDGYEKQIKTLGTREVTSAPRKSQAAIPYLIKTKWGQGRPYNLQCPEFNGDRCLTGCVATAMAQILYYYKYPKTQIGSVEAYTTGSNNISVDAMGSTTFNWQDLQLSYNWEATDASAQEVAKLMRYCGQLVKMDYNLGASGALTEGILNLKDWGFTLGEIKKRADYSSQEEWESAVYNELQARRPVLYSGINSNGDNGHQFICDGYDGNGYFHINWGWNGDFNGNFLLSVLNPYNSDNSVDNFDTDQDIIVNLQPSSSDIPLNLEGTEFTAATSEDVTMNFKITWDDGTVRTCEVSCYLNDESRSQCIDPNYTGPITIPSQVIYDGNTYTVTGIGNNAFMHCSISSAEIPATVKRIGDEAFFNIFNFSVRIPSTVETIGANAFGACYNSAFFVDSNTPLSIPENVFSDAENSNMVLRVPAGTKETYLVATGWSKFQEKNVYQGNEGTEFTMVINGVNVTFTIIEEGTEPKVKVGRMNANYNNTAVDRDTSVEIIIPETVTYEGTTYEVASIGEYAFYNIQSPSIILPSTIVTIGSNAIKSCYYLKDFEIPANVSSIGWYNFNYCNSLKSLTVHGDNSIYTSPEGCNAVIEKATNKLIIGISTSFIHPTVTVIGEHAFEGCSNLNLTIPETVTRIENDAFAYCRNTLITVTYEDLTQIAVGEWAFSSASSPYDNMMLKVPSGMKDSYLAATGWSEFLEDNVLEGNAGTEFVKAINGINVTFTITDDGVGKTVKIGPLNGDWNNTAIDRSSSISVLNIPETVEYEGIFYTVNAVGSYAFSSLYNIKQISLPATVESIGSYAFQSCGGLTSIEIPKGVTEIGDGAFLDCYGLTSFTVAEGNGKYDSHDNCNALIETATHKMILGTKGTVIPSDVTEIGDYAFRNIEGLTITIPSTVETIGNSAFAWCYGSVITVEREVPLTIPEDAFEGADETNSYLKVPVGFKDEYLSAAGWNRFKQENVLEGNMGVEFQTKLSDGTPMWFTVTNDGVEKEVKVGRLVGTYENTAISKTLNTRSVTVPEVVSYDNNDYQVTAIGDYAFCNVERMEQVVLPSSVTLIGNDAFESCYNLQAISIPTAVTSIGDYAFSNCNITSVNIPASVVQISTTAFSYCHELTELTVDEGNTIYESRGCNALIEKGTNKLVLGTKGTTKIPRSVTEIGDNAFSDINGLNITIPKEVLTIGSRSFAYCSPSVFTVEYEEPLAINDDVFYTYGDNNSVLKVPSGTKEKYQIAQGWSRFKSENVLEGNEGMEFQATIGDDITLWFTVTNDGSSPTVKVGHLTGSDENRAFEGTLSNKNVTIPQTVRFKADDAATEREYTVTAIGDYALSNSGMSQITMPSTIQSIGSYAFKNNHNLRGIVIPVAVTSISSDAFRYCSSLVSITVEEGNTTYEAPDGCNALIKENTLILGSKGTKSIPETVTAIGENAFFNMNNLEITIPATVQAIGDGAFAYCYGSVFTVEHNNPLPVDDYTFRGMNNSDSPSLLKVPAGCKEKYLAATGWKNFLRNNVFEGNDGVEFLASVDGVEMCFTVTSTAKATVKVGYLIGSEDKSAISRDIELEQLNVPQTVKYDNVEYQVTAIGSYAFYGTSISGVVLPESITEIGGYAFADCWNMQSITIPASVTDISSNAFQVCGLKSIKIDAGNTVYDSRNNCNAVIESVSNRLITGISTTVIPSDVTQIASHAFMYVKDLAITIPESVNYIEEDAFVRCDNMTITVKSENPILIDEYAFFGVWDIETNCKLRVPVGSKDAYLNAIGWNRFLSDNVTEYGSDVIIGDANGDQTVNVNDVVTTVDRILERETPSFVFEAADVNKDDVINVSDVVGIVDIILGRYVASNARQREGGTAADNDCLQLVRNSDETISLCLDNQNQYVAAQFDVCLASGNRLKGIKMNNLRRNGHQLAYDQIGNNAYRVLIYALDGQSFNGQEGELVNILTSNSNNISIENIKFITSRKTVKEFASLDATTTGIGSISQFPSVDIYTVDGRLVRKQASTTDGLKKGIYIIKNKKIVIR